MTNMIVCIVALFLARPNVEVLARFVFCVCFFFCRIIIYRLWSLAVLWSLSQKNCISIKRSCCVRHFGALAVNIFISSFHFYFFIFWRFVSNNYCCNFKRGRLVVIRLWCVSHRQQRRRRLIVFDPIEVTGQMMTAQKSTHTLRNLRKPQASEGSKKQHRLGDYYLLQRRNRQ